MRTVTKWLVVFWKVLFGTGTLLFLAFALKIAYHVVTDDFVFVSNRHTLELTLLNTVMILFILSVLHFSQFFNYKEIGGKNG